MKSEKAREEIEAIRLEAERKTRETEERIALFERLPDGIPEPYMLHKRDLYGVTFNVTGQPKERVYGIERGFVNYADALKIFDAFALTGVQCTKHRGSTSIAPESHVFDGGEARFPNTEGKLYPIWLSVSEFSMDLHAHVELDGQTLMLSVRLDPARRHEFIQFVPLNMRGEDYRGHDSARATGWRTDQRSKGQWRFTYNGGHGSKSTGIFFWDSLASLRADLLPSDTNKEGS